jgi:hypothetical protein
MVQGERGSCHSYALHNFGQGTSMLHIQNPAKSNGSNRELKEIIHIVVCKPNKAQQTSFQTIELTTILSCFIISVSFLFNFTFTKI